MMSTACGSTSAARLVIATALSVPLSVASAAATVASTVAPYARWLMATAGASAAADTSETR